MRMTKKAFDVVRGRDVATGLAENGTDQGKRNPCGYKRECGRNA